MSETRTRNLEILSTEVDVVELPKVDFHLSDFDYDLLGEENAQALAKHIEYINDWIDLPLVFDDFPSQASRKRWRQEVVQQYGPYSDEVRLVLENKLRFKMLGQIYKHLEEIFNLDTENTMFTNEEKIRELGDLRRLIEEIGNRAKIPSNTADDEERKRAFYIDKLASIQQICINLLNRFANLEKMAQRIVDVYYTNYLKDRGADPILDIFRQVIAKTEEVKEKIGRTLKALFRPPWNNS